jgi:acyl-CoA reductase-like NAD-dependent aldehyde dehydrogenase
MQNLDLYIGGKHVAASNNATFERKNPVSGEVVTVAAAASSRMPSAVDAAAAAFPAWSETGPAARRKMLLDAAASLNNRADDIVQAMKDEIGATEAWARFNVMLASNMLIEAASLTTQIKGEIIPSNRPGSMAMAIRQPAGVVLAMAPWNAPVILGIRSIATPLACGNTVVMKTSELCPRTHALIIEAVAQGGLPDGVLNAISNAPEDAPALVEAMIANPAVRRVNFTGSTRVGKVIGELAGRYLKPALLELGGKAPMILLEDADIDAAVAAAGFGAYMNQGQICMSTERIIAVGAIGDKFVEAFAKKVEQLTAGDPREGSSPLGSLVDAAAAERIKELIEDGVGKGAKLIAGGGEGTILNAAALDHVTPDMRLYTEESFGPVVSIIRAGSVDEAVRIANDSEFGLSSAVFSKDVMQAMNVAKRIESGICHINGPTVHDEAQMPFGGVKASGYGRFRRKLGHRGVHRTALDYHPGRHAALPDLSIQSPAGLHRRPPAPPLQGIRAVDICRFLAPAPCQNIQLTGIPSPGGTFALLRRCHDGGARTFAAPEIDSKEHYYGYRSWWPARPHSSHRHGLGDLQHFPVFGLDRRESAVDRTYHCSPGPGPHHLVPHRPQGQNPNRLNVRKA